MSNDASIASGAGGFAGVVVLRLLLLGVVLIEVCFLASRYDLRVDLTADQAYTLTPATSRVLAKLEEPLVIEAYFSPDDALPGHVRPQRVDLRNTLNEYVERGDGKVAVRYLDPFADRTVRETAERLGLQAMQSRSAGAGQLTATQIWQGFRIRYGARQQEVVPLLKFGTTRHYEEVFTPLIKRLTVKERPKVGVRAFATSRGPLVMGEQRSRVQGYGFLLQQLSRDFDFRPIDTSKGQLIPDDIPVALLIHPKLLSDREKFIFDQFLMRGGKLVVFADASEVEIRDTREVRCEAPPFDGPIAKLAFLDQLRSYGVVVERLLVAEGYNQLHQLFGLATEQGVQPTYYPYCFEAFKDDWKQVAPALAQGDAQLQKQYETLFEPGIDATHDLMRQVADALPGLLWPCPVGLTENLPAGVTGRVLMRSSPLSWKDLPKIDLDPFSGEVDPDRRIGNLDRWNRSKLNMRPTRNPVQTPLMVHLEGTFTSFFADKAVPPRTLEKKTEKEDDWDKEPGKKDDKTEGPEPDKSKNAEPPEPKLTAAPASATLVVIGDATFIRDDFIRNEYVKVQPLNGVVGPADKTGNVRGARFFLNMLNWLFQDRDLLEIHNRSVADRQMKFAKQNDAAGELPEEFGKRLERIESRLKWGNALAPLGLLILFGFGLWVRRSAQKRAFLSKV